MSQDLKSYEVTITKVTKEERPGKTGGSYTLHVIHYTSNGKELKTTLMAKSALNDLLKDYREVPNKTFVFEKKGQFNTLVNVLPAGEAKKVNPYTKTFNKGTTTKAPFNTEGMERGNALHVASRLVSALIHQGKIKDADEATGEVLRIAEAVLGKRSEPTKKEEEYEEVKEPLSATKEEEDYAPSDDFNDEIPF